MNNLSQMLPRLWSKVVLDPKETRLTDDPENPFYNIRFAKVVDEFIFGKIRRLEKERDEALDYANAIKKKLAKVLNDVSEEFNLEHAYEEDYDTYDR